MKRKPVPDTLRRGFSLLEMTAATAIMATVMVSCVVLVRTGYSAWTTYEEDVDVSEGAYAVLRHFVRELRQAEAVTAISNPSNMSGSLSIQKADGSTATWSHNPGFNSVYLNDGSGDQLLAWKVDELNFVGYQADGVTTTTTVDEIQAVRCLVTVTMPGGGGVSRSVSCRGWIRSW